MFSFACRHFTALSVWLSPKLPVYAEEAQSWAVPRVGSLGGEGVLAAFFLVTVREGIMCNEIF